MNVLVQQAQLNATRADHVATIRSVVTSHETENRALAGAVSADEPDVFTGVHLQGGAAQDVLSAVRLMNF
jgi:hypothetical protein